MLYQIGAELCRVFSRVLEEIVYSWTYLQFNHLAQSIFQSKMSIILNIDEFWQRQIWVMWGWADIMTKNAKFNDILNLVRWKCFLIIERYEKINSRTSLHLIHSNLLERIFAFLITFDCLTVWLLECSELAEKGNYSQWKIFSL